MADRPQLKRNAAGSEALLRYILDARKENYALTLRDLAISGQDY